jgi:hypothetical protein
MNTLKAIVLAAGMIGLCTSADAAPLQPTAIKPAVAQHIDLTKTGAKAKSKKAKVAKKGGKRKTGKTSGYKSCGKLMYRDKKTKKCVSATSKKS